MLNVVVVVTFYGNTCDYVMLNGKTLIKGSLDTKEFLLINIIKRYLSVLFIHLLMIYIVFPCVAMQWKGEGHIFLF